MLLFVIIFGTLFAVTLACIGAGFAVQKSQQNKRFRAMLRIANPTGPAREVDVLAPEANYDAFRRFLNSLGPTKSLDQVMDQAGLKWGGAEIIMAAAAAAAGAALLGSRIPTVSMRPVLIVAFALAGFGLPLVIVFAKRRKRIAKFEEQFPEALDFISRSMRAGHGFAVGMEMLVADSPEPLSSAFRHVLNDMNLGSPLNEALAKLVANIPSLDVRFFTASVLLQQETGGNLSEILTKLSHVIRERFRLKGQVKAASAHGRITGLVLVLMPVGVAAIMSVTSPSYLALLVSEKQGKYMIVFAIVAQVVGYLCIKKIVKIKV
jgi:tight adherence protein B